MNMKNDRSFTPRVDGLELRAMLSGGDAGVAGYAETYAPPPESTSGPIGGVLGGPEVGPSGSDPTAFDPSLIANPPPDGVLTPPPPPEGDTSLDGYVPLGVGPVYSPPAGAFD